MTTKSENLREALDTQSLVRVHTFGAEALPGRIIDVNDQLVLMEIVDEGVRYDGYVAVSLDAIWKLDIPYEWHEFVQAALDHRGIKPKPLNVPIDSWQSLIEATRIVQPIYRFTAPDIFYADSMYGYVVDIDRQHVRFRPIDMDGVWHEYDQILALSKLIRLDFGGDLETMLASLTIDLGI